MRRFTMSGLLVLCLLSSVALMLAQSRVQVDVPKVSPGTITIDGKADEGAWSTAATANVISNTGFNGWFNYYGRTVTEPDFPELSGKMLYTKDTLYVFIHIKDVVNDSSGLYFPGNEGGSQWSGDQLFVMISSRLGVPMGSHYDYNVYAAPDGPYGFLIMGNRVTLNDSASTNVPAEWQRFPGDTVRTFNASDYARFATVVDTATGQWDVEMAIYNPNIAPGANLGFNFGGSQGSRSYGMANNDAYAYWAWQPNVTDSPFATPAFVLADTNLPQDPGGYNLINSDAWALLNFVPSQGDFARQVVAVPRVSPDKITIDGKANEAEWKNAATANIISNTGFGGWFNYYGRTVTEPDYPELWGKMLWARDTIYAFIHIKDVVNDSSGLYFPGNEGGSHWSGDQLFVSVSSRLGLSKGSNYDFDVYTVPEGPYNFLVEGNRVTLNDSAATHIPEEWQRFPGDTVRTFSAAAISRYAVTLDTATGLWDVEMAIYNPNVAAQSKVGFDFGGSQGSRSYGTANNDAYAYWTWAPAVTDSPFATPSFVLADTNLPQDPGGYNLINADAWPLLRFDTTAVVTSIDIGRGNSGVPEAFTLAQNYPNPFNPSTTIKFALPRAAKVGLKVYNVLGQVVATLVNGNYAAGTFNVQWNASQLASGVYFYRLTADGNVIDTKKMMLVK